MANYSEPDPDGHVFVGPNGGAIRAGLWRQRFWAPAVSAAGLAPLRPHDLRHTAVSLWAAAGASPNEVAARAGHTSVSVVLDRYRHLFPAEVERTNERLEAMFDGATGILGGLVADFSRDSRGADVVQRDVSALAAVE
jgi:integrase